jgi:hypothetical protein
MIRLANTPMPHVAHAAQSVLGLFRSKGLAQNMHRPIPAPEPDPEPNPGPDANLQTGGSSICTDDWDEMFHAIQQRLENCVNDARVKAPELPLHSRHELTKATVLECVESMQLLHAALTVERQSRQKR